MILKKNHLSAFIIFLILLTPGCDNSRTGGALSSDTDGGVFTLNLTGLPNGSMDTKNTFTGKSVNPTNIQYYHLVITGEKNGTLHDANIAVKDLPAMEFKGKVENNISIVLEALDINQDPVMGNAKIAGYGNIIRAEKRTIDINWARTPVALIINRLIADGEPVQSFDPAPLQALVDDNWNNSHLNQQSATPTNYFSPVAVNIDEHVSEIKNGTAATAVHSYDLSSVVVTINGYSDYDMTGMMAVINDPFAAPVEIDFANRTFTFNNIAPGNWTVKLIADTTGTTNVIVPETTGTVTSTIHETNNKPVLYDWNVVLFNDNGAEKVILSAYTADEDGDTVTTEVTPLDAEVVTLADNGGSVFYDTAANDGVSESIIQPAAYKGTYTLRVTDSQDEFTVTKEVDLDQLAVPEITSHSPNEIITVPNPTFTWTSVTDAAYYSVRIIQNDVVVDSLDNMANTVLTFTPAIQLQDGSYSLEVYAHSNPWFFPYSDSYDPMVRMSRKVLQFTVDASGTISVNNPDFGEERVLYYKSGNSLYKLDILESTATPIYTSETPYEICGVSPDGLVLLILENGKLYKQRGNGAARFLLFDRSGEPVEVAKWSPDGNKIAFVTKVSTSEDYLYICDTDGSGRIKLANVRAPNYSTSDTGKFGFPFDFSRDSAKIYYLSDLISPNIRSINIDGTDDILLVDSYSYYAPHTVKTSPDGQRILYMYYSTSTYARTVSIDGTDDHAIEYYGVRDNYTKWSWLPNNQLMHIADNKISVFNDEANAEPINTNFSLYSSGYASAYMYQCVFSPSQKNIFVLNRERQSSSPYDSMYSIFKIPTDELGSTLTLSNTSIKTLIAYGTDSYDNPVLSDLVLCPLVW